MVRPRSISNPTPEYKSLRLGANHWQCLSCNIRWLHRAKGVQTPAIGSQFLYLATGTKEVHALDPRSGAHKWTLRFGYGNLAMPVLRGDRLWISTGDAAVLADAKTGDVLARLQSDDGQNAPVAAHGSWMHMVTNSGALVGTRVYR